MARTVYLAVRAVFDLRAHKASSFRDRDEIMALFGPIALGLLLVAWLVIILAGYTLIYWGLDTGSLAYALKVSGSSLFTLGFAGVEPIGENVVIFTQAGVGLLLAALLVAYLPVIYQVVSSRER